jgi:hypothetical protein
MPACRLRFYPARSIGACARGAPAHPPCAEAASRIGQGPGGPGGQRPVPPAGPGRHRGPPKRQSRVRTAPPLAAARPAIDYPDRGRPTGPPAFEAEPAASIPTATKAAAATKATATEVAISPCWRLWWRWWRRGGPQRGRLRLEAVLRKPSPGPHHRQRAAPALLMAAAAEAAKRGSAAWLAAERCPLPLARRLPAPLPGVLSSPPALTETGAAI